MALVPILPMACQTVAARTLVVGSYDPGTGCNPLVDRWLASVAEWFEPPGPAPSP